MMALILIMIVSIAASKIPYIAEAFIYDRSGIANGEWWRLLTGHFVHFSNDHLMYDLSAFAIAGLIIKYKNYRHFILLNGLMACTISIVLFFVEKDMLYYGGLSGLACGSMFYLALKGLFENSLWRNTCLLILIFIPLKIVAEFSGNESLLPYTGERNFMIVPLSHVIGSVTALLLFVTAATMKTYSVASGPVSCKKDPL